MSFSVCGRSSAVSCSCATASSKVNTGRSIRSHKFLTNEVLYPECSLILFLVMFKIRLGISSLCRDFISNCLIAIKSIESCKKFFISIFSSMQVMQSDNISFLSSKSVSSLGTQHLQHLHIKPQHNSLA